MTLSYFIILLVVSNCILLGALINYASDYFIAQKCSTRIACDYCGRKKEFISDYILMPRRCLSCGAWVAPRIVYLPLLSLLMSALMLINNLSWIEWIAAWVVWCYCWLVGIIDWEIKKILSSILIVGLLIMSFLGSLSHGIFSALWGSIISLSLFFILYVGGLLYKSIRFRNKIPAKNPISINDVLLSGIMGLILGKPLVFQGLALTLGMVGVVSFFVFVSQIIQRNYHPTAAIPLGALMSSGALIVFIASLFGMVDISLLGFSMAFPKPSFPFSVFP